MKFFSRLSFHHRIFVLIGLFVVISISVMWFFIRPLYERQVVEERTTVIQQLQHFAVHTIDEKLEQWITIAQYLSWNLQNHPNDVDVLIRQQIAFDTTLIQIIVSSPGLSDEFIATSSAHPNFSFCKGEEPWTISQKDSTLSILWINDSSADRQIFGIQKKVIVDSKTICLTLYTDSKYLLRQLDKLPIGGRFAIQIGGTRGPIYNSDSIAFPIMPESWQNLSVMQDVPLERTEWKVLSSRFSTVPMYLLIGIPKDVIIQPVKSLLLYSITVVLSLTFLVVVFGWIFSRQLSKPVTQLVKDVELLKTLDFSQPISMPKLKEILYGPLVSSRDVSFDRSMHG